MQLPFFSLSQDICSSAHAFVQSFLNELQNSLEQQHSLLSIDRFEGNFAVCENSQTGNMHHIPRSKISSDAQEGDLLRFENGNYVVSKEATHSAQSVIQDLLQKNKQLS